MFGAMPAFAEGHGTALDGTEAKSFSVPSTITRTWTEGPFTLHEGATLTGVFDFGALKGTVIDVVNDKIDFSTGNGRVWGKVNYTVTATGVTCKGWIDGKLTAFLLTAHIVARCSDGRLLLGTYQDVSNNLAVLTSTFHGELLNRWDD